MDAKKQGDAFERRVGHLFALLGYRVEYDALVAGRQVDLILEDRSGPLTRRYIVECKDHARPVSTSDYDSFSAKVRAAQREMGPKIRGILVASVGFVKQARAHSNQDDIELVTVSELETSLIDFRAYVHGLNAELTGDPSLAHFVPPRARRETLQTPELFFDLFDIWLRHPTQNQLTLLGDFGTGKTTLLKHIALQLARRHLEAEDDGARLRVPIYIDLRDYTHAISLKQIVLDFLDHHGIRAASYSAFEHVLREGQILLLLDGFDEMASRGNYKVTLRNFRELHKNVLGRAKIVLSCRTHYFTTEREVHRFHGQSDRQLLPRSYTDLYRDIAARPNFLLVHLLEFTHEQIESYLQNRCGPRWREVLDFIDATYNLAELSRRPVLLDMIVTSERQLDPDSQTVSAGLLYQVYTDIWLTTNDWSTVIDLDAKEELLETLARHLSADPDAGMPYRQLPELIRDWSPGLDTPSAIEVDRDLRTATFLVRDADGCYRFSHQSFQEFFYTRALLSDAESRDADSWAVASFATEIYRFVRDLLPERPEAVKGILRWLGEHDLPSQVRINAAKCLGAIPTAEVTEGLLACLAHDPSDVARQAAATALADHVHPQIDPALEAAARRDRARFVRANCLTSLARRRHGPARRFLVRVLRGDEPEVKIDNRLLLPVFHAARDTEDPDLVEACLERAPRDVSKRSAKDLAAVALDIARRYPSDTSFDFAETVLRDTRSPRLAALALEALPAERRALFLDELLPWVRSLARKASRHPHLPELVAALAGLHQEPIRDLLDELLSRSAEEATVSAASKVMLDDYPQHIALGVQRWTARGRPHGLKIRIAEHLAKTDSSTFFDLLGRLLDRKERVITRLASLSLVHRHFPDRFGDIVEELWPRERTPKVKRAAAELLIRVDRPRAHRLLLESLGDSRTGTRIVACSILGAATDATSTEALLKVLGNDPSPALRMQALRSLCAPGRAIERNDLVDATADEPDTKVIDLRRELLG